MKKLKIVGLIAGLIAFGVGAAVLCGCKSNSAPAAAPATSTADPNDMPCATHYANPKAAPVKPAAPTDAPCATSGK
jgi:hypothetical protein